jgi:hypothetical protein
MSEFDFKAEPKKNFTNLLLWQIKEVFPFVYTNQNATKLLKRQVLEIIDLLDEKSKNQVFKREIEKLATNDSTMSFMELRAICSKFMSYLHESYLQDTTGYKGIDPDKEFDKEETPPNQDDEAK